MRPYGLSYLVYVGSGFVLVAVTATELLRQWCLLSHSNYFFVRRMEANISLASSLSISMLDNFCITKT